MAVVAVIPARAGSKRIRHKNIKMLWGKPLIAYTIEASVACPQIDRTVVSTDDPQIREVALRYGAEVIDRPEELATDEAKTEPVLLQVVQHLEAAGAEIDIVVLLQPTSPLRSGADISAAFAQFHREQADSLVSVTEEYRLYWRDGQPVNYSLNSYGDRPRLCPQDMQPFLKENGAVYITRRAILMEHRNRLGGKIAVYRMAPETEVELDTRTDWLRLQRMGPGRHARAINENGTFIIAEAGCNHQGDVDIARRMIDVAAYCQVDAIKFQKRDIRSCLSPEQYAKPYDNPHSFGQTYGEHREYLELSLQEHQELKEHAEAQGLNYFSSVWDAVSARQMLELGCTMVKIPSACITDRELIQVVDQPQMSVLASVGMSDWEEVDALVGSLSRAGQLYVLQCTSTYPCDFSDIHLNVMPALAERYRGRITDVGFSGHHLGIALDVAAVALGARVIERHFTLDRTWKGTDHAASLEPEGMRRLVRDVRAFEQARGSREKTRLACEHGAWQKLRKIK